MELREEDHKIFDAFLSFLRQHPEIEKYELQQKTVVSLSSLEIHLDQRKVFCNHQEVFLTRIEYEILLYLFQNFNRVLTYSQIYERIWQEPDYGEARKLVSHHVQSIRRKLHLDKNSGICLRSIREIGYSLEKK